MATFIGDYFGLGQKVFDDYGALNVSIVNDLPLFIDAFLLFNNEKDEYQKLHDHIIQYLVFCATRRRPVRSTTIFCGFGIALLK